MPSVLVEIDLNGVTSSAFTCSYTPFRFLPKEKGKQKQQFIDDVATIAALIRDTHLKFVGPYSFYVQIFNIVFIYILHKQGLFGVAALGNKPFAIIYYPHLQ